MRPQRRGHPAEHSSHERWLVSYADFMTLLFAFFVVLFSSSHHDHQSIQQVSKAIKGGFKEMGAGSLPVLLSLDKRHPGNPAPPSVASPPVAAVDLIALQKQLQSSLAKEIAQREIVMRMTPEGFVISLRELGFFNSGEAKLLPGASEKIKRIASALMQGGFNIRVEGHSDDVPIHTAEFRSNWELSTARAMAVLLLLVDDSGFDPTRISVAGYGQYRPVSAENTEEGRRMNRRVDLVVIGVNDTVEQVQKGH